jgi:pyroglutamyl-peptidase
MCAHVARVQALFFLESPCTFGTPEENCVQTPDLDVMHHLIVTGFGPFAGVQSNPTTDLIAYLRTIPDLAARLGVRQVDLHVLKVASRAADAFCDGAFVDADAADDQPVLIVHLGVDAGCKTPTLALEACAYNECGFRCPDEDGAVLGPECAPCAATPLAACLETGVDVERLKARMEERARENGRAGAYGVRVSRDAGRFLCNYVYARSLSAAAKRRRRAAAADALFVHVPPFAVLGEREQRAALLDLLGALVEVS